MKMGILNEVKFIPLEQVDSSDMMYADASDDPIQQALVYSIERCGIITPLVLEEKGPMRYRIIDGFRRVQAVRKLGFRGVPGMVSAGTPGEQLLLRVALNAPHRGLDEVSLAEILLRLMDEFGLAPERISLELEPLIGTALAGERLSRLERLARLPGPVRQAVRGRLATGTALALAKWKEADQLFFLAIAESLQLGSNKQRELFELLDELSCLRDTSPQGVWEQSRAAAAVSPEGLSPADRYREARMALARLRYPTLTRHQAAFDELRRRLRLPRGADVRVPPFFEGSRLEITLRPASLGELSGMIERLQENDARSSLQGIFEML